jgi:DNA helicase IV
MLRKIITLNKAYMVEWTPEDVCNLLSKNAIRADKLVQSNKHSTNKLIKDFFLLACRASLCSAKKAEAKANLLRNYAKSIKQISNDYDDLFRRQHMTEAVTESDTKIESSEDSSINNIDRMQARLFYLTTQFSVHPCTHLAGHIVELLTSLCKHPHIELLPAQHYIYSQSLNYWRSRLIKNAEPRSKAELH